MPDKFSKDVSRANGLSGYCRECMSAYQRKRRVLAESIGPKYDTLDYFSQPLDDPA